MTAPDPDLVISAKDPFTVAETIMRPTAPAGAVRELLDAAALSGRRVTPAMLEHIDRSLRRAYDESGWRERLPAPLVVSPPLASPGSAGATSRAGPGPKSPAKPVGVEALTPDSNPDDLYAALQEVRDLLREAHEEIKSRPARTTHRTIFPAAEGPFSPCSAFLVLRDGEWTTAYHCSCDRPVWFRDGFPIEIEAWARLPRGTEHQAQRYPLCREIPF